MNLDIESLKGLVGEATVNIESARMVLDETHATADDLENAALRPLWAILEERVRRCVPIDAPSILAALRASQVPREVASAVLTDPAFGVCRQRLEQLRLASIRRRVDVAATALSKLANSGASLADLDAASRAIPGLLVGAQSRVRNCAGDTNAILDNLEAVWANKRSPTLRTGFEALDELLGGLINNLHVIGAQPGVGKSALVAGLVRNFAKAGVRCGVLAYEDDARDMQMRIIACEAGISVKHVRGDYMASLHQQDAISDGMVVWSKLEHLLDVDDTRPSGTPAEVVASMRTMVSRGCRVLILDNLTCVRLDGRAERHDLLVEQALNDFRDVAQSLRVPVIVIGHLKRSQSDIDETRKPPKLSDFANSSAWDRYSRVALGMWRDGDGVALKVLKQTNGPPDGELTLELFKPAAVVVGATSRAQPMPAEDKPLRRRSYAPEAQ